MNFYLIILATIIILIVAGLFVFALRDKLFPNKLYKQSYSDDLKNKSKEYLEGYEAGRKRGRSQAQNDMMNF